MQSPKLAETTQGSKNIGDIAPSKMLYIKRDKNSIVSLLWKFCTLVHMIRMTLREAHSFPIDL